MRRGLGLGDVAALAEPRRSKTERASSLSRVDFIGSDAASFARVDHRKNARLLIGRQRGSCLEAEGALCPRRIGALFNISAALNELCERLGVIQQDAVLRHLLVIGFEGLERIALRHEL